MVGWGKAERRWKKTVEEALAPGQMAAERDRLAAELAKRIWVANGGAAWATVESDGTFLALETMVVRYLSDAVLRTALGLKYLQVLDETHCRADYEDASALAAERRWAGEFLRTTVFSGAAGFQGQDLDQPGESTRWLEAFYQGLTQGILAELKAAEIAA